jgi:hypothetical protein
MIKSLLDRVNVGHVYPLSVSECWFESYQNLGFKCRKCIEIQPELEYGQWRIDYEPPQKSSEIDLTDIKRELKQKKKNKNRKRKIDDLDAAANASDIDNDIYDDVQISENNDGNIDYSFVHPTPLPIVREDGELSEGEILE